MKNVLFSLKIRISSQSIEQRATPATALHHLHLRLLSPLPSPPLPHREGKGDQLISGEGGRSAHMHKSQLTVRRESRDLLTNPRDGRVQWSACYRPRRRKRARVARARPATQHRAQAEPLFSEGTVQRSFLSHCFHGEEHFMAPAKREI